MTLSDAPVPALNVRRGFYRRSVAWLFSQRHFHLKLLSGTAVGIVVITFLAGIFLFVTIRHHQQETLRSHTIDVMRLSGIIENDIAGLESGHRGFLLTGEKAYLEPFEQQRALIKERVESLTQLILDSPRQRKRVMKIQEIVQKWLDTVALPQIAARRGGTDPNINEVAAGSDAFLGVSLLNQAREILQSLQNEEQIVLNQRMREQEWAAQSTQILDFLTKLERSLIEMQKEKRGFLLTGDNSFAEAYKNAAADFYTYHGYLSILIANSPEQSDSLSNVRKTVERWMATSVTPEMEAKRNGKELANRAANSVEDALMSEIRQTLATLERNEVGLYELRSSAGNRARIIKTTALAILCVFAVGLLVVSNSYSFVLVRRQLAKLEGVETRIRSIIENILDGMITVDADGVIRSMNPAAEKMFGCINNEMVGHTFTKLVPKCYGNELEAQPVACAWDDLARRTGSTTLAVGRTRRHTTFSIEISLSEMVVDRQKLYVAMIRDVTERKRFERDIAADKESLAITLRSIGDGVITTDVQGKVIMINNAGENLTGWSSREAIGQPL
ncbi:MAG TPA: CHASE3 domain-containing protein, partial [Chthoniobacterales bacterium]